MTRLALLIVILALITPAAAASGSTAPGYYGCSGLFLKKQTKTKAAVRPSSIVVACADAGFELIKLHWTSWTATSAHATGTASQNDCTPNCAAGHFHSYPATVRLSRVRTCKNGVHTFTQLAWTYTGKRPAGVARQGTERYSC